MSSPFDNSIPGEALERKIEALTTDIKIINRWIESGRMSRNSVSLLFLEQLLGYWQAIQDGLQARPPVEKVIASIEEIGQIINQNQKELDGCKQINEEIKRMINEGETVIVGESSLVVSEVATEALEKRISRLRERQNDLISIRDGQST